MRVTNSDTEALPRKLTAAQAARESGLSKRTILYDIEKGLLKAEKLAGVGYIIRRGDFTRYIARRERASA